MPHLRFFLVQMPRQCHADILARVCIPGLVPCGSVEGLRMSAIASLLVPGLGQACQGRIFAAFVHFTIAMIVWIGTLGTLGWIVNLCSAFGAASWRPKQ